MSTLRGALADIAGVHVAGHHVQYLYMFYVYVIESEPTDKWYIGYSSDLKTRVKAHNTSGNQSTRPFAPWKIIYYEAYTSKEDAIGREKFLKSGSGWRYLKKQMKHYLETK